MVTPLLLPVHAVAALTDHAGGTATGMLVGGRRSCALHVLMDEHGPGRSLTPTGRVRRGLLPLCNRRPLALRAAQVDGRPLCRRCARAVHAMYGRAALAIAATWVTPTDLAVTLLTARDQATVAAGRGLLIESGQTAKVATIEGRSLRLTQLVAQARTRVTHGPLPMTEADRAWISLVQRAPLGRSRPRRRVS